MTSVTFVPNGYLDQLSVRNYFTLADIQLGNLSCSKEIYFLGENGDGKTLLLQALVFALKGPQFIKDYTVPSESAKARDMLMGDPAPVFSAVDHQGTAYGVVKPPDNPSMLPALNVFAPLFGYGVSRGRIGVKPADKLGFMTLFDDEHLLLNPVEWLKYLYTRELEGKPVIPLETVRDLLRQILDEGLDLEVSADGVTFIERGSKLNLGQLSEGYRGVMTWVLDLLIRLADLNPKVTELKGYQGIVLVDEVGLHLHPKWEMRFVSKLRQWFPGVQFIFTTHSPITVMGASEDAVFYKLYKENGVTKINEPFENHEAKYLMANALITSPLFGLSDARMRALDEDELPDTAETYLHSLVYKAVREKLAGMPAAGARLSKSELESLVNDELKDVLG